jgi:hypothetical protein
LLEPLTLAVALVQVVAITQLLALLAVQAS